MATLRAFDVDREPPKPIRPTILINLAIGLRHEVLLAFARNLDSCCMNRSAALDALPWDKRRPWQGGLICVVADEPVPPVKVGIQKQMALAALLADGSYEKEEPAVDFSSAWDDLLFPLVRLTREKKFECFPAARTTNGAREWRFIDRGTIGNDAVLQVRWDRHHSVSIQSQRTLPLSGEPRAGQDAQGSIDNLHRPQARPLQRLVMSCRPLLTFLQFGTQVHLKPSQYAQCVFPIQEHISNLLRATARCR